MSSTTLIRFGGLATILAGVLHGFLRSQLFSNLAASSVHFIIV